MATTCTEAGCANAAVTSCAMCGKDVCQEHAKRADPLITARQLSTTIVNTTLKAPGMLGDILMKPLDKVDYCPECRQIVAERRQVEQLKFLFGMILILAIIIGVPLFFALN